MKNQPLIIAEHHPMHTGAPAQTIRQTITAWLIRALSDACGVITVSSL